MAYSDFTLDQVVRLLEATVQRVDLFRSLTPLPVPEWLSEALARGLELAFFSEKARSEFIVGPVLLTARDLSHDSFTIYSGQRLDVMPEQGLVGECDFILVRLRPCPCYRALWSQSSKRKRTTLRPASGNVSHRWWGPAFSMNAGSDAGPIFGCVTTGETWQFLRLDDTVVGIDRIRYHTPNVWQAVIAACQRVG